MSNIISVSDYNFLGPRKIVFGWGRSRELGGLGRSLGRRAFLISGSRTLESNGTIDRLAGLLKDAGVELLGRETLSNEPEVDDVDRVAGIAREKGLQADDFLVAIGGGSAIDLAKAVGAMAVNCGSDTVCDYLEGVGVGLKLDNAPVPVIAIPTTAGAGTEATKNAVISSYDPPFKKSLRDERMIPQIALVDPELSVSCPASVTANSGMDAITQLIESYVTRRWSPIPRAMAEQGLAIAIPSIVRAVEEPDCRTSFTGKPNAASETGSCHYREARERMSHAAMLSGICLANAGLGLAHGVAPSLGVNCRIPHGQACALMLPVSIRVNRTVCEPEYARLARLSLGLSTEMPDSEAVDRLIETIETISRRIGIPRRLSDLGITPSKIPAIVAGSRGNSMTGNPRELSDAELTTILEQIQ